MERLAGILNMLYYRWAAACGLIQQIFAPDRAASGQAEVEQPTMIDQEHKCRTSIDILLKGFSVAAQVYDRFNRRSITIFRRIILILSLSGLLFGFDSTTVTSSSQHENHWDKTFGIEINPISLIMSKKNDVNIKGSFSLFNISRKIELAFPFEYIDRKDTEWYDDILDYNRFTLDCQPRVFLRGTQKGFYFSTGLRYTYEYGIDDDLYCDTDEIKYYSNNKIGVSFGIGYRYFSPIGLYWGVSLFGGRYFTDTDIWIDNLSGVNLNPDIFFTIELLKFGYAF